MRRFAWIAAALAAACGGEANPEAGPLDRIVLPTGMAVHQGRLLVASSNADLRFDTDRGGTVLALDVAPDPVRVAGAENIHSFAGDLAVADPTSCASIQQPLALVPTRGANTLNALAISGAGGLSCGDRCGIPLPGAGVDALAVTVACGGGRSRAFVGYLRAPSALAWVTEYDLASGDTRSASIGAGPVRAFAYDAARDRLYALGVATGAPTPLRWIELGGGCELDATDGRACTVREGTFPSLPAGLELRSMALGRSISPTTRRAFLTARLYDAAAAALVGGRTVDFGGLLLVVNLVEDAVRGVDLQLVRALDIGRGAQEVRVLPSPAAGDVVAALDESDLWIYDDATGALGVIGRDPRTGVPRLGHQPYGLAVDPDPVGTVVRLYVGSFRESYVTPVDVPLDRPDGASIVEVGGAPRRITGGTP